MNSTDNIIGVVLKDIKSHGDERGFFREVIRHTDPVFDGGVFGQWSHSRMVKDVVKAWHYHHLQTDWWYVSLGVLEVVLFDNRQESPTYRQMLRFDMGEAPAFTEAKPRTVRIPPGVLHGCKVLTAEAHLLYITSHIYDPNDEGRFPYNDTIVNHHWGENVITVENDRRFFEPRHRREALNGP
jgi:dTDP-4-dehydrorhamnose 3,5-epimerase